MQDDELFRELDFSFPDNQIETNCDSDKNPLTMDDKLEEFNYAEDQGPRAATRNVSNVHSPGSK